MLQSLMLAEDRRNVDALIERFRTAAPAIAAEAQNPVLAQDMCEYWSAAFVDWLAEQGVEAETIVCEGSRIAFRDHSWDHRVDFSEYWHVVARVMGHDVDWSRRQFERDAPVPHVATARQSVIDWKLVMPHSDYIAIEEHNCREYEAREAQAA